MAIGSLKTPRKWSGATRARHLLADATTFTVNTTDLLGR